MTGPALSGPDSGCGSRVRFRSARARFGALAVLAAALLLSGCDALPRDSVGTLRRVQSGGELRVGVADNPPWVRFDGERVRGIEPELIEGWAKTMGARVRFRRGAEAELVEALHRRELDVMAAGFDSKTPHAPRIGPTQPYVAVEDRHGKKKKHVLAVTQGESALLLSLDRFLAGQNTEALRRRAQQEQWEDRKP